MATRLNIAFLVAIAALIQISTAQTNHTVGDTTGWTIASGGATFYSNWAASQTFAVGDVLVFTFTVNQHDVAKVSKADYDACTTTNPILLETASPARIPINATGEHYFICNFTGHCSAGQKLMINVSAATAPAPQPSSSSPAPQPSTPTPVSAPSPSPVSTPPPSPSPVSTPPPSPSPVSTPPPSPSPVSTPPGSSTTPPPSSSTTPPPPTTPSSPSPSGSTAPPPPNSSARSLTITGLSATFLSIVVAFLY